MRCSSDDIAIRGKSLLQLPAMPFILVSNRGTLLRSGPRFKEAGALGATGTGQPLSVSPSATEGCTETICQLSMAVDAVCLTDALAACVQCAGEAPPTRYFYRLGTSGRQANDPNHAGLRAQFRTGTVSIHIQDCGKSKPPEDLRTVDLHLSSWVPVDTLEFAKRGPGGPDAGCHRGTLIHFHFPFTPAPLFQK